MSVERALEGWEEVQRQGQDMVDRIGALTQGLGCMLQSHMRFSGIPAIPAFYPNDLSLDRQWCEEAIASLSTWTPLPAVFKPTRKSKTCVNRVRLNRIYQKPSSNYEQNQVKFYEDDDGIPGLHELSNCLGQASAALGSCIGGMMHHALNQMSWPFQPDLSWLASANFMEQERHLDWGTSASFHNKTVSSLGRNSNISGIPKIPEDDFEDANEFDDDFEDAYDNQNVPDEQFLAVLTNPNPHLQRQRRSINVTTSFDSRTHEIESSFVARGDFWRLEASNGDSTSGRSSSPLFLLQVGPVLLVRDSTLLLPVHISKQHLLWYGFDRKNGVHSICPAIWSKHRRWLMMSMICLNPLTCSFLDFQSPNGQVTYIAGEGLSMGGYFPAFGGAFQAQGRYPGDTKLSFSKKVGWGTRITPSLKLPEKSLSVDIVQQLAWQRSGALFRPTVELSVTPTIGGRNAGWKSEIIHYPNEKLSVACGVASRIHHTVFASFMVGSSKRNGNHSGNSGLELHVEAPVDNISRASFVVQLNSGIEF